ncbi:hypothetical protein PMAYCL1PPCAC_24193, partial [Pristionchus mayeri]
MASTSNVEGASGIEHHAFEEEIEEETVWMDEEEAHTFLENDKKMRMAYGESHDDLIAQEAVSAEEYHEVDVEEYDEAVQVQPCNLPDLISKKFNSGDLTFTVCFSKRGSHQLAFDGYLYNLEQTDESHSTWSCINPECTAHIISSYDMATIERDNDIHVEMCERDEAQLRLRIAIYDLRLMAEFTEVNLEKLYDGFATQFSTDNPELADIFPSFDALQRSLEDHRRHKLYRRNFDLQGEDIVDRRMEEAIMHDESILLSVNGEEVVEESYSARVPMEGELATARHMHLHPYGRTRGFPPTYCFDCGIDMDSNGRALTLQHALVQHVNRMHHAIKIHTFVFEPAAFEMWLREVQRCPVLRFRRFSLLSDDMYYLCSCDSRLPKTKFSQPNCCCTAYIKINDYRSVSARQARLVSIEYSFEHFAHDIPLDGPKAPERMIADLRPEEFLFQMERRKLATANLVRSRQEMNLNRRFSIVNSLSIRTGQSPTQIMRVAEDVFSPLRSQSRSAISRQVAFANKPSSRLIRPSGSKPLDPPGLITRRANFQDLDVFESVRQFEQLSHIVVRRLQSVKSVKVAEHYADIMRRMANKVVSDLECAPEGSAESVWSGMKTPRNGRNPAAKRSKSEDGDEEGRVESKKKKGEEETREAEKE